MRRPLGRDPTILGQMAADCVDELGSLAHEQVAGPEHQTRRPAAASLFTGTKRIVGRCAASQIASASAASFFCRFTNGLT